MKIYEALKLAAAQLKLQGFVNPFGEAQLLLAAALGQEVTYLIKHDQRELTLAQQAQYQDFLERRLAGEPYAYITGQKAFLRWHFKVSPAVLIPRPETELLVELAAEKLKGYNNPLLADIGVGSGVIGLSLLALLPGALLHGVDISPEALAVARENAINLKLTPRAEFFQGDLLEPLQGWRGQYRCITANLPYIPEGDYLGLQKEVLREPKLALTSGQDGLDCYGRLIPQLKEYLAPGGWVFMEIGHGQGLAVKKLLEVQGFNAQELKDLAGLDRIVWGQLNSPK